MKYDSIDFTPPAGVRAEAQKGLDCIQPRCKKQPWVLRKHAQSGREMKRGGSICSQTPPPPRRSQIIVICDRFSLGDNEKTRGQFGKTHAAYTTRFIPFQVGMIWRFRRRGGHTRYASRCCP